jgi:hypothetical protein
MATAPPIIAIPSSLVAPPNRPKTRSKKWAKFPEFVRYANAGDEFLHRSTASVTFADDLSHASNFWPAAVEPSSVLRLQFPAPLYDQLRPWWSPDQAWEILKTHQRRFRELLDGIIARFPSLDALTQLRIHCDHEVITYGWLDDGDTPLPPGQGYYVELRHVQDPLDTLYLQLRQFLLVGGDRRLRRCPVCQRYFVQRTDRAQTYCGTACGQQAYRANRPYNAEKMRAYRARTREQRNSQDFRRVREVKKRLRDRGEPLVLDDILHATGLSHQRWAALHRWEIKKAGKARVTALL